MNDFSKFNNIRKKIGRNMDTVNNMQEVSGENGFKCVHILWLYPDVMNIHGGRGDIMALLHMSNVLGIPVEIRRCDSLKEMIDWNWPHLVYMTAGELKCTPDVAKALKKQEKAIQAYVRDGGIFVANGSSGAVLADNVTLVGKDAFKGLGLLHMDWKERLTVWGDDIWISVDELDEDIVGNQIQVADVHLAVGQNPFGKVLYGRGNDGNTEDGGSGLEGARTDNVIYTGVLGPVLTKNPKFTAYLLKLASEKGGISGLEELKNDCIEM
ncbi:MAG: hypothetical protein Q4B78_04050, partial [Bacillota bacterium]|nr:hypothetical protein [Bacillota bacterium]